MKLPMYLVVFACLAPSATAVLAQRATNCTPTKTQVTLRQQIAEMDATAGRLDAVALREDVTRLFQEGKIDKDQLAGFEKIIEKAQAPKGPVETPEGRTKAEAALAEKISELQKAPEAPAPPTLDPAAEAKARAALAAKLAELQQTPAPSPATAPADDSAKHALAQEALRAKLAELANPAEVPVIATTPAQAKAQEALAQAVSQTAPPASATTPDDKQALALQALQAKMAELNRPAASSPTTVPAALITPAAPRVAATADDKQALAQQALQAKMAELNQAAPPPTAPAAPTAPVAAPAPAPAVVVVTPAPAAAPAPAPRPATAPRPAPRPVESTTVHVESTLPTAVTPQSQQQASQALQQRMTQPAAASTLPPSTKTGLERLKELNELYRGNKITPQEYHAERAKVLKSLGQ